MKSEGSCNSISNRVSSNIFTAEYDARSFESLSQQSTWREIWESHSRRNLMIHYTSYRCPRRVKIYQIAQTMVLRATRSSEELTFKSVSLTPSLPTGQIERIRRPQKHSLDGIFFPSAQQPYLQDSNSNITPPYNLYWSRCIRSQPKRRNRS